MADNRGRRRRQPRSRGQKGRMRSLNRPQHLQTTQTSQQSFDNAGSRKDRPMDGVTKRRIRDDRIFGALCHAGIFLGIWGIVTTAAIWAYRKDRSRVLRFQGTQALIYQLIAQFLFLAAAVAGIAWASDVFAYQEKAAVALRGFTSFGFLAGLGTLHFIPLTVLHGLLGFVAILLLILCLCGLEPSYPIVGGLARKALGLRAITHPEEEKEEKDDKEEKEESPESDDEPASAKNAAGPGERESEP